MREGGEARGNDMNNGDHYQHNIIHFLKVHLLL